LNPDVIQESLDIFNAIFGSGCIRWRPKEQGDKYVIRFVDGMGTSGCKSFVGRYNVPFQPITLDPGCLE